MDEIKKNNYNIYKKVVVIASQQTKGEEEIINGYQINNLFLSVRYKGSKKKLSILNLHDRYHLT